MIPLSEVISNYGWWHGTFFYFVMLSVLAGFITVAAVLLVSGFFKSESKKLRVFIPGQFESETIWTLVPIVVLMLFLGFGNRKAVEEKKVSSIKSSLPTVRISIEKR